MATVYLSSSYIERMKEARRSPSVLKIRLATLRSGYPNCLVLAFEGDADKSVYYQWIRRIRPELEYEPFPCDGKTQVFELQDMLERDRGNLRSRMFFFVDRDFDDLRGRAPRSDTFVTDCYSVENYLVSCEVLDELLKDEFHCHGQPEVRIVLIDLFKKVYAQFLSAVRTLNFKLFVARRLFIPLGKHLPDKINSIANVSLMSVSDIRSVDQLVAYQHDVDELYVLNLRLQFEILEPANRYRGKFSFLFFMRWLNCLVEDRNSQTPQCFSRVDRNRKTNVAQISIGMLASKSDVPIGLAAFVNAI